MTVYDEAYQNIKGRLSEDSVSIPRDMAIEIADYLRGHGVSGTRTWKDWANALDPEPTLRDEIIAVIDRDRYDKRIGSDSLTDAVLFVIRKYVSNAGDWHNLPDGTIYMLSADLRRILGNGAW